MISTSTSSSAASIWLRRTSRRPGRFLVNLGRKDAAHEKAHLVVVVQLPQSVRRDDVPIEHGGIAADDAIGDFGGIDYQRDRHLAHIGAQTGQDASRRDNGVTHLGSLASVCTRSDIRPTFSPSMLPSRAAA